MGGGRFRALVVLMLSGGLLVGLASQAAAHTRTQETTNIVSRVTSSSLPDGVEVVVHTGGLLIEVENRSATTLVVHGYESEPYLRIGPAGVEHNRRSPATYVNQVRYGEDVATPQDVDASAAPEWIHIEDEPRFLWHDHRTHWMSTSPPRFVEAGPLARGLMTMELVGTIGAAGGRAHGFRSWVVPLSFGDERIDVAGELVWDDPPPAVPWLLVAACVVAPALLGIRGRRRDLVRPAAVMVGLVAAVNGIHLVDDLIAWPGDPLDELFGLLHTTIFLTAGLGGAIWAYAVASGRVLALGIASASVLYHQGFVHLPLLYASQFPTVWPDGLVRLTVALGLLQVVPVVIVVLQARRRSGDVGHPAGSGEPSLTVDGPRRAADG